MTTYVTGTATVAANGTTVTGQGTAWLTAGVQAGDLFWARGLSVRIAAVNGNTSLTLAFGWPGSAFTAGAYEVRYVDDGVRGLAATLEAIEMLKSGNLSALAGLTTAADRLAYYTGAGAAALATLTPAARAILALAGASGAKVPVVTASGTAALRDIVGNASQSSGVPTGAIIQTGENANGRYWRYAGGMQVCMLTTAEFVFNTADELTFDWTYPAAFDTTPACHASLHNAGASAVSVSYDAIGAHRYGGGASSTGHILQRTDGGAAFTSASRLLNVRLSAIGAWHG